MMRIKEMDKDVYIEFIRIAEILITNEYHDMYEKIFAVKSVIERIESIMADHHTRE